MAGVGPPTRGGAQVIPRPSAWRMGDPPPWANLSVIPVLHTDAVVDAVVRRGPSRSLDPVLPEARGSAVLIALADGADGAEVVLTRRSKHLRNHRRDYRCRHRRAVDVLVPGVD